MVKAGRNWLLWSRMFPLLWASVSRTANIVVFPQVPFGHILTELSQPDLVCLALTPNSKFECLFLKERKWVCLFRLARKFPFLFTSRCRTWNAANYLGIHSLWTHTHFYFKAKTSRNSTISEKPRRIIIFDNHYQVKTRTAAFKLFWQLTVRKTFHITNAHATY